MTDGASVTDPIVLDACRLMGAEHRPRKRLPHADLLVMGEYAMRSLAAAQADGDEQMAAYFDGMLDVIRHECDRRVKLGGSYQAPGRVTAETLEKIKAAVFCWELIGETVKLKPVAGKKWLGLCPFHQEKTGSFTVWNDHWHCFGCGLGGDIFEWARTQLAKRRAEAGQEGEADFIEAVREVARFARMPDQTPKPPRPLPKVVQL